MGNFGCEKIVSNTDLTSYDEPLFSYYNLGDTLCFGSLKSERIFVVETRSQKRIMGRVYPEIDIEDWTVVNIDCREADKAKDTSGRFKIFATISNESDLRTWLIRIDTTAFIFTDSGLIRDGDTSAFYLDIDELDDKVCYSILNKDGNELLWNFKRGVVAIVDQESNTWLIERGTADKLKNDSI